MSHGFVPSSRSQTGSAASLTFTPTPRGNRVGTLAAIVVVVGVLCGLVVVLRPFFDRLFPQPAPLPAERFDEYRAFFEQHGEGLPQELSIDQTQDRANECAAGRMTPNAPAYLATDDLLRARGAWVCLVGTPVKVDPTYCTAPGTGELARQGVERGHLIAVRLGGVGSIRDGKGGCMNITALDVLTNTRMRDGLEREAYERAALRSETVFYLSVPVYFENRVTPMGVSLFAISSASATIGEYLNPERLWKSGDLAR